MLPGPVNVPYTCQKVLAPGEKRKILSPGRLSTNTRCDPVGPIRTWIVNVEVSGMSRQISYVFADGPPML